MKFSLVLLLALPLCCSAIATDALRHSKTQKMVLDAAPQSFVRALEFQHRLRVCNAYPYQSAVDVYRGKSEKLTETAMSYKQCQDFKAQLKSGDKLEFKVGNESAGTFSVSSLPNNDAVLLLIMYRHDEFSTAVSFESHVFANLLNAQIAVIDTFKGKKQSKLQIRDHPELSITNKESAPSRAEDLRYDSVVAVNPGQYECVLVDNAGKEESKSSLIAVNRESYIVLRVGVEAEKGKSYKEEVIVFPQSTLAQLKSNASAYSTSLVASVFALFAAVMMQ